MNEAELAQAILDYIKTEYKAEYTGSIKVTKDKGIYSFIIGVPSYMFPTLLSGDFETDEDFLDYIKEELRIRNYMRVYFYEVKREPYISKV
jgi:hypothetical protein